MMVLACAEETLNFKLASVHFGLQLALEPVQEAAAKPKKAEAKKPAAKKGKGKGKGKQNAEDSAMTRAEFFQNCPVLRCAFDLPGNSPEESRALAAPMDLVARTFKSGGAGWFSSVKFDLPVGAQQVTVQAQVVMNVSGSKYWEDGEGLEAALKALDCKAQQAVAKHDDPNSAEAPCTPKRRAPRSLMQVEAVQAPVADGGNKLEEASAEPATNDKVPIEEAAVPDAATPDAPEVNAEAAAVPNEGVPHAHDVNAEAEAAAAVGDEDMPDAPEVTADAEAEEAVATVPDLSMPDVPELTAEAEEAVAAVPAEGMPHAPEVHAEGDVAVDVVRRIGSSAQSSLEPNTDGKPSDIRIWKLQKSSHYDLDDDDVDDDDKNRDHDVSKNYDDDDSNRQQYQLLQAAAANSTAAVAGQHHPPPRRRQQLCRMKAFQMPLKAMQRRRRQQLCRMKAFQMPLKAMQRRRRQQLCRMKAFQMPLKAMQRRPPPDHIDQTGMAALRSLNVGTRSRHGPMSTEAAVLVRKLSGETVCQVQVASARPVAIADAGGPPDCDQQRPGFRDEG
eukprot:s194_g6.t1